MKYVKRLLLLCVMFLGLLSTDLLTDDVTKFVSSEAGGAVTLSTKKSKTVYVTKGKYVTLNVKTNGKTRKAKWKITKNKSKGKIIGKNNLLVTSYSTKTVKVKGVKKGTVYVSGKYKGKTYKAKVVVETPSISKTSVVLKKGESVTLSLNGTKREKQWGTTKSGVASVTTGGKVTGKSAGTCKIVGAVGNSSYTCSVRVLDINKSSLSLASGQTDTLAILGKATSKKVTWSSSNESVATVGTDGIVTAKDSGSCTITGKVHGKTFI